MEKWHDRQVGCRDCPQPGCRDSFLSPLRAVCPFPLQDKVFIFSLDQAPGSVWRRSALPLPQPGVPLFRHLSSCLGEDMGNSEWLRADGIAVVFSICKSSAHSAAERGWGWKVGSLDTASGLFLLRRKAYLLLLHPEAGGSVSFLCDVSRQLLLPSLAFCLLSSEMQPRGVWRSLTFLGSLGVAEATPCFRETSWAL